MGPHWGRWGAVAAAGAMMAVTGFIGAALDHDAAHPLDRPTPGSAVHRIAPATRAHTVHITRLLGRSVRHRPIPLTETGVRGGPPILVVGCVHGNEPAGIAVARDLITDPPP